jgi:hypothetical protein
VTQDDLALRIAGLRPREASLTAPRNPLDPFPSLVLPDSLRAHTPKPRRARFRALRLFLLWETSCPSEPQSFVLGR